MGGFAFCVFYQVFSSLLSPDKTNKQTTQKNQTTTTVSPPSKPPKPNKFLIH